MNLTFVYDVPIEYWNDGLKRAMDVLSDKWNVRRQNGFWKPVFTDFVLVWGAFGSKQDMEACESPFRKGICVAGGPVNHPNMHKYDVIFVETKWQQQEFKKQGVKTRLAFGTNTDEFYDRGFENRPIDYLYPAAFATWKRHELFLKKPGKKVVVGFMQPDGHEKECYEMCVDDPDTVVMPIVTPDVLSWLYNQSKNVAITSSNVGGGERTVLEALSCGCNVVLEEDNKKLNDLLRGLKIAGRVPDHNTYARQLEEGIKEVYET